MKKILLSIAVPAASLLFLAGTASAATLNVNNTGTCSDGTGTPAYCTIQAAVNAANSGDTIKVATGTYDAFQVVNKTNLTINGAGTSAATSTTVAPTSLINTGVGHKYTSDMMVSVFVNNSTGITLKNLIIQGNGTAAPGEGGPDALLFWNASSGTVQSDNITGTYTINGDQTGQGIAVDAGLGQTTTLTIQGTTISGFQKNGIDIEDGNSQTSGNAGTISVTITNGSITGAGATSAIAQNGIVAWNEGGGTVSASVNGTNVKNLDYTGSGDTAAAFLAFGGATLSPISNATLKNTQLYIDSEGAPIDATSGNTFDGVSPSSATDAQLAAIQNKIYSITEDASVAPARILPNTLIVTTANAGIQNAVNVSPSGGTVLVTLGNYATTTNITKSLTLDGAQAGNPVSGRTFGGANESTIAGNVQGVAAVTVNAANVKMDGFSISDAVPAFSAIGIAVKASDATIQNNIFSNITTADTGSNGTAQAIYMAGANDGAQILNNWMGNIDSNRSAKGVLFGDNSGGDGSTNALVEGNTITNVTSVTKGAYGISFGNTTNAQTGIQLQGNTIENLEGGGWVHAIGLEGNVPNINIDQNVISNLVGSSTPIAVWVESEDTFYNTAKVNNNSLAVGSSQIGLAVDLALTSGGTVNGTCNWWGDASGPSGVGSGTGSMVSTTTTYTPWLTSSNLTGSCNGMPPAFVVTNPATAITSSDATLNGTNGPSSAIGHSIWVSTSPFATSSPTIPAGVYSTPDMGAISANTAFSAQLSSLTTSGVPSNMPAVTPSTTYYFVAWSDVGGTWYPGAELNFMTSAPTPTYTVTIDKYLDSAMASAASANSNSFPMVSSWNAVNLGGAGSGSYSLSTSGFNSPNPYEAITSPMNAGSSYTTNEVTGGTVVGASCTTGQPYALVGYTTGATLAAASTATPSATVPNFTNLQQNEYVIVWNKSCPAVTTNPATNITVTDATLNGLIGGNSAAGHSLWVSTSPFSTASPTIPSGVYSTPDFGAIAANTAFSAQLSSLTTSGVPSHMPTVTPGTTYYFVAWAKIGSTWFPGAELNFMTAPVTPQNACQFGQAPAGYTLQTPKTGNFTFTLTPMTMFVGKAGAYNLTGGDGNYIVCVLSGNSTINLGNGNDVIQTGAGNENITLGSGTSTVTVGSGTSKITTTGGGDKTVTAGNGNQTITTGSGNDTITVGSGNSTINGGPGTNSCTVGAGHSTLTNCN